MLSRLGIDEVVGEELYQLKKVPSTFMNVDPFDLAMFLDEKEATPHFTTFLQVWVCTMGHPEQQSTGAPYVA